MYHFKTILKDFERFSRILKDFLNVFGDIFYCLKFFCFNFFKIRQKKV